ncbi:MAG TPA: hypothetical protein VFH59_05920 [Frateuria sp.]|uniref:hypothetical protein n=1 Tax=Frateuria sp. TaxID=2211372 RepID=UPI002D7F1DA4|nr:hypothetical protein [Frateuria sp.]HET6804967.1 hypothetical protein [Frateuria sp.]
MTTATFTVRTGELVALRLFDIAYAIDLARAEAAWLTHAGRSSSRSRLASAPAKAIAFDVPPLQLLMDPIAVTLDGVTVEAQVSVRLYDFGVAALAVRVPIANAEWPAFVSQFNALDRTLGPSSPEGFWTALRDQVREVVGPALERPADSAALQEDYLLGKVHALDEPLTANELRERVDLAALLSGETRPLSEGARRDLLAQSLSYYADDLVVLTWDRAFIYEPRGDSDVADVIEVANAQLLELRYYDELLDDELPRMYGRVEEARGAVSLLAARRFAHLARGLYTLVAETTELTEKVDNALQVTEDVYLARIYSTALGLFRVASLSTSVDRKLAIIRDTYSALYEEASSRRAELLEIAIVLLIVLEVVLSLMRP